MAKVGVELEPSQFRSCDQDLAIPLREKNLIGLVTAKMLNLKFDYPLSEENFKVVNFYLVSETYVNLEDGR